MSDIQYHLVRSRRLSANTSISISPEKGVTVRAPFWMPQYLIDRFVSEKTDWIRKHLQKLSDKKSVKKYEDGEIHLYFGQEYMLNVVEKEDLVRPQVILEESRLTVNLSKNLPSTLKTQKIKEALLYWYLERGIESITERVNHFSSRMNVDYAKVSLKKVSSIWGSCSPTNNLSFNRKLVMAPPEIVDYVVIHEVAHLTHRNHSQNFWNLVRRFDPDYREHRHWLRKNHHLLSL